MTIEKINEYYNRINGYLSHKMLSSAIVSLSELMQSCGDYRLKEQLVDIKDTYAMLLHYFIAGMPDSKRDEMALKLKLRLVRLNDELNFNALSSLISSDFFTLVRSQRLKESSIPGILSRYDSTIEKIALNTEYSKDLQAQCQEIIYQLFNKILVTQFLDKETVEILSKRMYSDAISEDVSENEIALRCAIIAALYLGCMQYYDSAKLRIMLSTLLNNRNIEVLSRTYVLLVLLLGRYGEIVKDDKTLKSLLSLISDEDGFHEILKSVIINYIRTLDTAKINKTIAEDILPGLIKLRPDLEKGFKEMEKNLNSEESEYNPEWEELLKKSGLEEKMRKLSDLQMEGGDMFMMAFSSIKKTPFFRNPANWFLPFNPQHTEVYESINRLPSEFSEMISESGVFCDSDSYSLFIGLKMMPDASVSMMGNQIKAQIDHLNEDKATSFSLQTESKLKNYIGRFIKDLYRFYNQFVNAKEFCNPFNNDIDFLSAPIAGSFIDNPSDLELIGTLYFKRKMWDKAEMYFNKYLQHFRDYLTVADNTVTPEYILTYHYVAGDERVESGLVSIMEKKGYALMRLKRYDQALKVLLHAQLYQNPSVWGLSKIAECLRRLGETNLYGKYLDKALSIDSDNSRLLLRRTHLFMENKQYDEAVRLVYKLNYIDADNLLYIRTLAWCRCLQGETQKALKLYEEIPMESREKADWLNIGHCKFALKDFSGSVDAYCRFVSLSNKDEFLKLLEEDIATLNFLKSELKSISLVRDAVLLNLQPSV